MPRYETQLIKIKTEICLLEQAIGAKKRKLEEVIKTMTVMMMITLMISIILRRRGKRKINWTRNFWRWRVKRQDLGHSR